MMLTRGRDRVLLAEGFAPSASVALDFQGQRFRIGQASNVGARSFLALPGASFANASGGYAPWRSGLLQRFPPNTPRITDQGILIEGTATNLLLWSQAFTNAAWAQSGAVPLDNQGAAPDGTTTAAMVTPSAISSGFHEIAQNFNATLGVTYVASWHFRYTGTQRYIQIAASGVVAGNFYANWDIATGTETAFAANGDTVVGHGIQMLGNGWCRGWVALTSTATGAGHIDWSATNSPTAARGAVWTPNGTDSFLLWGAQIEQASIASSYIPTTAAAATRSADVASLGGLSVSQPLTLAAQGLPGSGLAPRLATVLDGISADFDLVYNPATSKGQVFGPGLTTTDVGPVLSGQPLMLAANLTAGVVRASSLGSAAAAIVGTATIGSVATLRVGDVSGGNRPANGFVQQIYIYPFAATDARLQSISAGNW